MEEALAIVEKICYPVLVGLIFNFWDQGMVIVYKEKNLCKFVEEVVAKARQILIDLFLEDAT